MPALTGNGLAMRVGLFLEAMSKVGRTELIVVPASELATLTPDLPRRLGIVTHVLSPAGRWDTRFELIRRLADSKARLAAFRQYGRPSFAAALSAAVLSDLKALVEQDDYAGVHIARSYLSGAALAVGSATPISLDLDEDEAVSCRQMARQLLEQGQGEAADWMAAEADAFDSLIDSLPARFGQIFLSSACDRESLASRHAALLPDVVENAVSLPRLRAHADDGKTIVFVGSFGYAPNAAGCLWFAREVWPRIKAAAPATRLRLIGRDPPQAVRDLAGIGGIDVVGPVGEIADAYAQATVAIAPLHAGAGTRIKIIEAAAFDVPIVSTPLAARGLRFSAPEALWVAESGEAFAAAVLAALAAPEERRRRAAQARRIVEAHYDRADIVEHLASRFRDMLAS